MIELKNFVKYKKLVMKKLVKILKFLNLND